MYLNDITNVSLPQKPASDNISISIHLILEREVRLPVDAMSGRPVVEVDMCRSKYVLELRNRCIS